MIWKATGLVRPAALALAVLVPLVAAAAVRTVGLRHGEPTMVFHPDVPKQIWVAIKYLRGPLDLRLIYKDDIELTHYPYGTALIAARLAQVEDGLRRRNINERRLWTWDLTMRRLSVLFAIGGFAVVLVACARAWGAPATLVVGLLLALEPVNAQFSHYGMNDVPLVGLLLVAWVLCSRMGEDRVLWPWRSALAGAVLGIAFGVKYQALLAGVFPLAAWAMSARRRGGAWLASSAAACAAGALAGAFLTCPLLRHDPAFFVGHLAEFMQWQANITRVEIPLAEKLFRNSRHFLVLFMDGGRWLLLIPAAWACLRLARGRPASRETAMLISALAFCALLAASVVASRDYVRATDLMPITVFLVVVAGFMLAGMTRNRPRTAWAAQIVGFALACGFAVTSVRDSLALARPDTRSRAVEWCRGSLPPGCVVRRERYTLPINVSNVVEREHRDFYHESAREMIAQGHYDYLVCSSLASARFTDSHLPHFDTAAAAFYEALYRTHDRVAEFTDRKLFFAHPRVTVLRKRTTVSGGETHP